MWVFRLGVCFITHSSYHAHQYPLHHRFRPNHSQPPGRFQAQTCRRSWVRRCVTQPAPHVPALHAHAHAQARNALTPYTLNCQDFPWRPLPPLAARVKTKKRWRQLAFIRVFLLVCPPTGPPPSLPFPFPFVLCHGTAMNNRRRRRKRRTKARRRALQGAAGGRSSKPACNMQHPCNSTTTHIQCRLCEFMKCNKNFRNSLNESELCPKHTLSLPMLAGPWRTHVVPSDNRVLWHVVHGRHKLGRTAGVGLGLEPLRDARHYYVWVATPIHV